MDTVFESPTDLTPRIDGHILAAPSCGDNSAGVAGLLFLIAMIRDLDLSLPQGALFAFNVGEEGMGNLKGMRRIMADWKGRITEVVAVDCTFDDVVAIPVGSRATASPSKPRVATAGCTSATPAPSLPPRLSFPNSTPCPSRRRRRRRTTSAPSAAARRLTPSPPAPNSLSTCARIARRIGTTGQRLSAPPCRRRTRRPGSYDDPSRRTALQQRRRYLSPMPAHRRHPQTVRPRHALYFRQYRRQHPPQPGRPSPVLRRLPQPRRTHDTRIGWTRLDKNGRQNFGRKYVEGFNSSP